jgi:UDP-glucose:(heptosyl)LPS alpha-1,3-glucosyltransferase
MKFAFCLFKYFPYGGLQRDFLQIAETCISRSHQIDVYTGSWTGDKPDALNIVILPPKALTNHRRYKTFAARVNHHISTTPYDAVVGFNKIPGLDVYFAADVCYRAMAMERSFLYRLSNRCRTLMALERSVFDRHSTTLILSLSDTEKKRYIACYGTPEDRFHLLPPGISKNRVSTASIPEMRNDFREKFSITNDMRVVLMVGSDYKRKGVDRAIKALSALPSPLKKKIRLMIVGKGRKGPYLRLAKRLKVAAQVDFFGERDDVPRFLAGADLFLHPAYHELAGMVLIEALSAGLPVLATDTCGCGFHVDRAGAGMLVPSPFNQETLNRMLASMLTSEKNKKWGSNGKKYVKQTDVYSMHQKAADLIEKGYPPKT